MYIKHFPTPLAMALFLEDFVSFVPNPDFFDEYSPRVYNEIKPPQQAYACKLKMGKHPPSLDSRDKVSQQEDMYHPMILLWFFFLHGCRIKIDLT